MFLVPIFLVAGISISHVVAWYDITNPFSWAIYLSIAIEIGAITALIAATQKIKGGVWFMFGLVTFVQMVGNELEIKPTTTMGYNNGTFIFFLPNHSMVDSIFWKVKVVPSSYCASQ